MKKFSKNIFNELKDEIAVPTWQFVLFEIITSGIYGLLWLYGSNKCLKKKLNKEIINSYVIVFLSFLYSISFYYDGASGKHSSYHSKEKLIITLINLFIASLILIVYIYISFKAKDFIEKLIFENYKSYYRLSGLFTFLLGLIYINYNINKLPQITSKLNADNISPKTDKEKNKNQNSTIKKAILNLYNSGKSVEELSKYFEIPIEEIRSILKENMENKKMD